MLRKSILVISDQHAPYHHIDTIDFLAAIKQKYKPDFVLIDGRFRVASFLTSIKFCDDGCKIIFDDYANRPHYHVVEEIIKPIKIFGNQALFEIKDRNSLQENEIDQLLTSFEHVRD